MRWSAVTSLATMLVLVEAQRQQNKNNEQVMSHPNKLFIYRFVDNHMTIGLSDNANISNILRLFPLGNLLVIDFDTILDINEKNRRTYTERVHDDDWYYNCCLPISETRCSIDSVKKWYTTMHARFRVLATSNISFNDNDDEYSDSDCDYDNDNDLEGSTSLQIHSKSRTLYSSQIEVIDALSGVVLSPPIVKRWSVTETSINVTFTLPISTLKLFEGDYRLLTFEITCDELACQLPPYRKSLNQWFELSSTERHLYHDGLLPGVKYVIEMWCEMPELKSVYGNMSSRVSIKFQTHGNASNIITFLPPPFNSPGNQPTVGSPGAKIFVIGGVIVFSLILLLVVVLLKAYKSKSKQTPTLTPKPGPQPLVGQFPDHNENYGEINLNDYSAIPFNV